MRGSGSVVGVDVGFSPLRRSSAICRLDWDEHTVGFEIARFRAAEPERRETILRLVDGPVDAAAFDGPLRGDLAVIGVYRLAERMLTVGLRTRIGKPGQSSAPVGRQLNAHANICAGLVMESGLLGPATHEHAIHERSIVEAFPNAFLGLMIEKPEDIAARRGDRSDKFYVHLADTGSLDRLLGHVLPGRRLRRPFSDVTNHDDRAAVVCALTALCVAAGEYCAVGDDNGWIVLPPATSLASWALPLLEANGAAGGFEVRSRG